MARYDSTSVDVLRMGGYISGVGRCFDKGGPH